MRRHLGKSVIAIAAAIMSIACSARQADSTGPTTIDGTLAGKTLTLTIPRDYGPVETFTGTLTDATHLSGPLAIEGSKHSFAYAKQ